EELAGLALGADTLRRTCTEAGTMLQDAQERAAARVEQTRAAAEPVEPAPEQLVVETDGVMVRFGGGWHEAKVGLVAGCRPDQPRRPRGAAAGTRLLHHQPRPDGLSDVPCPRAADWLRSGRIRGQDRRAAADEAQRDALERSRRPGHPRPVCLPSQRTTAGRP